MGESFVMIEVSGRPVMQGMPPQLGDSRDLEVAAS